MPRSPRFIVDPQYDTQSLMRQALLGAVKGETNENPISFAEFSESTLSFELHRWQRDYLCPLLERFRTEKGLRIILHAPSQLGKSVLVSQRLPAWLIGCNPKTRIALASYNQEHAINFGKVIIDIMQDENYSRCFPNSGCRLDTQGSASVSSKAFSVNARVAAKDGQYSFSALGLNSGFTGRGVDLLIIDDPYASAEDARSEAVNNRTWRWWDETAYPRTSSDSNVLVVYHRYSLDDLGARLLAQSDAWENVRFPMVADDNLAEDDPTTFPREGAFRVKGDLLSPLRNQEWVDKQRDQSPGVFFSQSQGTPILGDATLFNVDNIKTIPMSELPKHLTVVRSWDFAATGKGDWTAGTKIGIDFNKNNTVYIIDVKRSRKTTDARDEVIIATAKEDGYDVPIAIPEDPAAAGKAQVVYSTRQLIGYIVSAESVSGDKVTKASPVASQSNVGNLVLVEGAWNNDFKSELRSFPLGKHDDQVDSMAQGFNYLIKYPRAEVATNIATTKLAVNTSTTILHPTKILVDEHGITSVITPKTLRRGFR